jgi:hypothetical protein
MRVVNGPLRTRLAALASVAARRRGLLVVILVFVAIVGTHFDAVPFWDSKNYLLCVEVAVGKPFDPLSFRCWGHPSLVYLWVWSLTQYLWPWTPAFLYATNAVVGIMSIAAFDGLLRHLFPGKENTEYALVTALYALAPLFVSHAIFLNLDYGATALFVLFLYFLVARRFWTATAVAVALIFTKETGAAAWAVTMGAYIVACVMRPRASWAERAVTLRSLAPLLVVPIAVGAFMLFAAVFRHDPGGWVGSYAPVQVMADRVDAFLNTNLADSTMRAFLADIFVLNFQWLYTGVVVVALCAASIRVAPPRQEPLDQARRGMFLALTLAGLVYIVTRYRFSNAARYVLLATPLLILAFYHALLFLCARRGGRLASLAVCAFLVFASNFRSIDFVSRWFFGTFAFGSHVLLDMTSLTSGLKLDSIVYNLEFLQLQYLFGDMIRDVRPRDGSILLMGNAIYNFPPDVDGRDYSLTADLSHAVPFFVALGDVKRDVIASHVRRDGQLFYYIAFANADNVQLQALLKRYPLVRTKTYERHGYTLDLYTFRFSFTA